MDKIIVLGSGMVGRAIALDLAKSYKITLADIDLDALDKAKNKNKALECISLDVTNKTNLKKIIQDYDLVVCAVPGHLGYKALEFIIDAGKDVVDISFSPENTLELENLAKEKNITAIVDSGVAPGMDNLLLGYYDEKWEISHFECLVGGLPKVKKWPFCYKAPFSPFDVIEEYIRPARYVENGRIVTREPLSDCEYVEFDKVGTLEAFNTDGLRSILFTMPHIPNMREKTLRYPGHAEYIRVLKHSGFFSEEELNINGQCMAPLRFTARILTDEWKLKENEKEFTVMRVTITGKNENDEPDEVVFELYDEFCDESSTSSMARTTGYTATASAHLILKGLFNQKGVFPLERVGKHEHCFNFIMDYLKERNVTYTKSAITSIQ